MLFVALSKGTDQPTSVTAYPGQTAVFNCTAEDALSVKMQFEPPISDSRFNQTTEGNSTRLFTTSAIHNVTLADNNTTVSCCILLMDQEKRCHVAAKLWVHSNIG